MLHSRRLFLDEEILTSLKQTMWEAADALMYVYRESTISHDLPAATLAGLGAYEVFLSQLAIITPEIPVVCPLDCESWIGESRKSLYWLVNPLDGEREFTQHQGEFTCTLALIENGMPVFGFVVAPLMDELFCGGSSMRSSREGRLGKSVLIHHARYTNRSVRVVAGQGLCGSAQNYISTLEADTEIIYASSSLNLIKIATGEADICPQFTGSLEWDTAAGQAILEGAGGSITAVDGQQLTYGKPDIQNPCFIASAI